MLMILCATSINAYDFVVDGIYYNVDGTKATVTYKTKNYDSYSGDVTIPASVQYHGTTYSVTTIGDYAFLGCHNLTSVNISSSVTSIGEWAFYNNNRLTSITIPNSVTSIGADAFIGTPWYDNQPNGVVYAGLVACSYKGTIPEGTSISIKEGTLGIADATFFNKKMTSINIPNSVTTIGAYAFEGTPWYNNQPDGVVYAGLVAYRYKGIMPEGTSISLKEGTRGIASHAFIHNNNLTCITIPNTVTTICKHAFFNCSSLTSVIIPDSIATISCRAFGKCSSLSELTIGASVNSIENSAFEECNSLKEIICLPDNPPEMQSDNCFTTLAYQNAELFVPYDSENEYRNTPYWYNFNKITARVILVENLALNMSNLNLYIGNTEQLIAEVYPANATHKLLTWLSSEPSVATVNVNGLVTARSAGNAQIIVKTVDGSNLSDTCYVTVMQRMATSISLNQTSSTLHTGDNLQLSATVLPSNADDKSVTWTTSNPSVATVSSNGLVTAISAGNAIITAKTADGSNLSATCAITVKQLATSISLNKTSETLYMGNTLQLIATVYPSTTSDKSVSWSSSNTAVATVSSDGLVTPKSTGTATITVRTEDGSNLTAQCIVTVKQYATSITLSETDISINTGNTFQLSATVLPSTTSNPSVTWSSSNTSVATVSSTGLVTAKSTGEAAITAKTADGSNLSASCNVTVKRLATSISLNKTSATLYLDQTVQLTATVSPSNATDKTVNWSSSDNSIAKVASTGLVTAIAPGEAVITATTADGSDLSATCVVTVKAYVTSLTLDQSEATILEGDTITLTPTILPTYATNQNINWSSSNTSVVSVNNGVVVGRSGGEATVTARTADGSNLSATCNVTVVPNFDITMPNLSHVRGSSNNRFDLTIDLANRYDITGMQFDMQLPDGVTIAEDGYGEYDIELDDARKTRNHTATANSLGNNTYRILVSSATANALKGHYGTVLHIMVEVPVYHVSGNKQVKYTNIVLSEPDETRHTLPTKYSQISYYYKEGDANADVSVDVADYVITGNYILQNGPEYFWYDAANVDHNSTVDVNDLTGITNIALGRREGGILQMPAIQQTAEDDIELDAKPLEIQKGQTKTLELCLNENFAFAGFQMDIQLPEGLRLVDASLADGDSGLSIATAELPDGSIRLLASSFSLKDLAVNNSSFLSITLSAEDEIGADGRIVLNGIKFSKRNMSLHTVDHYEIPVGNGVSSLEQVYSRTRIYPEGKSIIIDSPESGTARIVTIAGISLSHDVQPGHNVIPMEDAGLYIVTLNGTTAKLYLK